VPHACSISIDGFPHHQTAERRRNIPEDPTAELVVEEDEVSELTVT
jgi:hypothetical protein